ncbi:class I SAM-dependent methyltransferase [Gordonia sp. ABSL1-1]|uniref:class I SAM-dependent methyltransferase n=1 Tax=Gordonia sp. ABSL1-1 TaxID=3053923 RepID=UPI0025724C21|nr:class I SAM-dependent methyltransferase [Gordonia sp. ABSL1-1]MDL9937685.1 class I SAM-dependent methyltransferase [Gordonia sp. ABSL1-1]
MTNTDPVSRSYSAWSEKYIDVCGSISQTHPSDRALVRTWAGSQTGTVLDAGSGPGQWTNFLAQHGVDVRGIDLVPEFVDHATTTYPGLTFDVGSFEQIDVATGSLGGVLTWYTTIHHRPEDLPAVFDEFARVTRPGGGLLVGFFEWPDLEPFGHLVTQAYRWPVGQMGELIEAAGFDVVETHTRTGKDVRPHGAIVARRRGAAALGSQMVPATTAN